LHLQGLHQVLLDGRQLKTPARHPLAVPSRALALAIAAEWRWQARRAASCALLRRWPAR